jgi:hypothetical protein
MRLSWLAAGTLAAALLSGCAATPTRRAPASVATIAPDRWERALCRLGEYPPELDARALARARYEDLRARLNGSWTLAAARLESERDAFDARCAAWRSARADLGI